MQNRVLGTAASVAALAVVLAAVSACSTAAPMAAPLPSSSSSSSSAPAPSQPPSQQTTTVVVVPAQDHTVTRVVQAPAVPATVPQSGSSLEDLYYASSQVDAYSYSADDGVFFDSPSQNIGCFLSDQGGVACSITRYEFDQPGPDCNAGIGATLYEGGSPSLTDCSGAFAVANRGPVLAYGQSIADGDFACVSESSGISCLNVNDGTGFTLSRQAFSPVY